MEYLVPLQADEVKDYTLQIKIKNGPMLNAMRQHGFYSASSLSRASGVGQMCVGRYLNLTYPPMTKKGKWHKSILRIAKVLHTIPDFIFPQQHLTKALEKNQIETNVSLEDIQQLTGKLLTDGPEVLMLADERLSKLKETMECLTERERKVIEGRYYVTKLKTLEELGAEFNISRERIRQIENLALKKMKKRLKKIYPEYKE